MILKRVSGLKLKLKLRSSCRSDTACVGWPLRECVCVGVCLSHTYEATAVLWFCNKSLYHHPAR